VDQELEYLVTGWEYDGISLPLVLLTGLISMLAMASWSIKKHVKGYLILFLLLETGMMGVFLSLDFFLFYIFWEVMLLPMYFLIGVWGGPRREYAAIKFFLYTLFGGVLMLIAMLMFYFGSAGDGADTFNLLRTGQPSARESRSGDCLSQTMQITAFILLFIGFAIKCRSFPFHTWLPDAHVEAPDSDQYDPGGRAPEDGGIRHPANRFSDLPVRGSVCRLCDGGLGVISIIYGAFAAMAQTDFKRLVAYSSVSHMGYVLLGLAVWKINESTGGHRNGDLLADGDQRGDVPDDRSRDFLGRHVLYGRRDLRPRAPSRPEQVRRTDRLDAAVRRTGCGIVLRRSGTAGDVRIHR
jgi:NADH-quinone oxidoreductase subunit M